jgi:DNA-binding transcriptional LysR family regulator
MSVDAARRFRAALDVRRMRVLREVARRGSITGAADALDYTPSAVSQQLRVLEAEAGVALLERTPRSVTLTAAGEVLVRHTEVIMARLQDAEAQIRSTHGLQGGRLRLATFRSAAETLLAEAVVYFRRRYPEVELALREGEPEEFLAGIRTNEYDLALDFTYDFMDPIRIDGVERTLLMHDPMVVALPTGHRLADVPTLDLADLAGERWIVSTRRNSVHRFTALACSAAGFTPRVALETDDYHVAQSLVAGGLGVTFVPALIARIPHAGVVIRPLSRVALQRRIYAVHRPGGDRAPAVAAMLEVLRELGGELDGG